jgi:hypothetical protein
MQYIRRILVCHYSRWILLLICSVQNGRLPFTLPVFVAAWMTRELLFVLVYFEAIFNVRRIQWGKRTYRLSNFGQTLELDNTRTVMLV